LVSFLYLGSHCRLWVCHFCTQVVIFECGKCGGGGGSLPWLVLVFGCHITVSDVAPGFPVSKESGGRGVFTHLGWVDVPCCCHCVTSIWPALVHLVTWRCCVVLVVLGHSVVGWLTRVRHLGLSVLVVIVASDMGPQCRWLGGCRLPLTCQLLTWHSCIVRMVYWCVQVVVSGGQSQWCGDNGWVSWVGIMGGGGGGGGG